MPGKNYENKARFDKVIVKNNMNGAVFWLACCCWQLLWHLGMCLCMMTLNNTLVICCSEHCALQLLCLRCHLFWSLVLYSCHLCVSRVDEAEMFLAASFHLCVW